MKPRQLRWKLTAWYTAILVAIVLAICLGTYPVLARALSDAFDNRLMSSAAGIAERVEEDFVPGVNGTPAPDADDSRGDTDDSPGFLTGGRGDAFYLVLAPDGHAIENPLSVPAAAFADGEAVRDAIGGSPTWRTVEVGDATYRLLFLAVTTRENSKVVIEVGRSLAERTSDLRRLVLTLAGAGAIGVVLAVGGGWLVAGRAIQPVELAFEKQRQFVADASHELRTPITLIHAGAEALERHGASLAPVDRETLADILGESDRMTGLIADLLDLARLESGVSPASGKPVDLGALLAEACRDAETLAAQKQQHIVLEPTGEAAFTGDKAGLRRVLRILLENAIRYSPARSVIEVRSAEADGQAEVSVQDRGPGIDAADLSLVFERFYRTNRMLDGDVPGSGLGLAIAKAVIESYGGRIWAESEPGQGARFTFRLPLRSS